MRVMSGLLDYGHVFLVRKLNKNRRKAGVSLFMYFIDLQKTYDSVDRTLLWQVLTRIRVPPQMIAVIRQLHDGMRACVQPDNDVCSDWFEVKEGLQQECVLQYPRCCSTSSSRPY